MSTEITLTLPDDLYQQAQQWADLTQRDLSEALTDALSLVLTPLPVTPHPEMPVVDLADDKITHNRRRCGVLKRPAATTKLVENGFDAAKIVR